MIKKIFIILILLTTFNLSYARYNYNSSYTDLTLDSNGWCANLEIEFKVWNETDFLNQETIYDDLCEKDCKEDCNWNDNPDCLECEHDCTRFNYIDGAIVKIYDGPLDSLPLLLNTTTNATGGFKYMFDKPQQHLVEIFPKGNYNDFHQIYDLFPCGHAQDTTIKKVNEQINPQVAKDYNFIYQTQGITLDVKQSLMNSSKDITIDESIVMPTELINAIKHFEITAKNANFTTITMKIQINNLSSQGFTTTLYKYNSTTSTWTNMNYQNLGTEMSFDVTKLGIYAIAQTKPEIVDTSIQEEVNGVTPEENQGEEEDTTQTNNTTTTNNKNLIIAGVVGVCLILLIVIIIAKKKGTHNHYHEHRNEKPIIHEEKKEILTTYEATYQQAKTYTQKYKEQYGKDVLYRALEKAKVPKDIIDKVFNEEF